MDFSSKLKRANTVVEVYTLKQVFLAQKMLLF